MLEVTAGGGGGGGGARAPVPPPLWIRPWAFGFYVIELSGMRVTLLAPIVYLFTIPQRRLADIFCIKSRCQLLTETFAVNFWLKYSVRYQLLLVSRFDWNFWLHFAVNFWLKLLIAFRCQLLITAELSNLRQHFWIQTDSCRRFDSKVAV